MPRPASPLLASPPPYCSPRPPLPYEPLLRATARRWYTATVNSPTPPPDLPQPHGLTPPDTRATEQPEEEPEEEPVDQAPAPPAEERAGNVAPEEPEPAEEESEGQHDTTPALLSLDQAAAYAGRKPTTLRRALRADKLPRRYRPGLYGPELVFTPADVDAWLSDMARAVETMPSTAATAKRDGDAAATDDAAQQPATDSEPSTALVELDTLSSPIKLYALVALAYAQRLAAVEEVQQQQADALADVRAQLARLEARPQQQPQPPAAPTGDTPAAPVDEPTPAIPAPEATKGQRGRSRWEKARAALIRALS